MKGQHPGTLHLPVPKRGWPRGRRGTTRNSLTDHQKSSAICLSLLSHRIDGNSPHPEKRRWLEHPSGAKLILKN